MNRSSPSTIPRFQSQGGPEIPKGEEMASCSSNGKKRTCLEVGLDRVS